MLLAWVHESLAKEAGLVEHTLVAKGRPEISAFIFETQ
jgi:hypothetical protein